jgi:hypothetical protein
MTAPTHDDSKPLSDADVLANLTFRTGWKCLTGGAYTFDREGDSFPTFEAAKGHAKRSEHDPGLGRRVFLVDADGGIYKSWRVRLGPDYLPHGHRTGWGMW